MSPLHYFRVYKLTKATENMNLALGYAEFEAIPPM